MKPSLAKDSAKALSKSKYALNSSKRKRLALDSDDDYDSESSPDAQLARRLQDEEYKQTEKSTSRAKRFQLPTSPHRSPLPLRSSLRSSRHGTGSGTSKHTIPDSDDDDQDDDEDDDDQDDDEDDQDDDQDDDDQDNEDNEDNNSSIAATIPPRKKQKTASGSTGRQKGKAIGTQRGLSFINGELEDDNEFDDDYQEGEENQSEAEDNSDIDTPPPRASINAAASSVESDTPPPAVNIATRRGYRRYRQKKRVIGERERLEQQHPILTTMWTDLEKMPVLKAGKAEQPKTISRILKPFQLEGVAWMMAMEKTKWKGGLLGDEMGLGKTIQAVSLIMSDYPAKRPSLVLVPPVALMQWVSEIESYTDGTLKTLVFHGTNTKTKKMTAADIKKYDVIIMSYNSLESMYRKQEKGFKREEGVYMQKSMIHATRFHRVILDEAHSIKVREPRTGCRYAD